MRKQSKDMRESIEKEPTPIYVAPDFRVYPEQPTVHRGKRYMIRVCEELIAGRWEGFVAMKRVNDQERRSRN